jgi:hypothetical protein
MAYSEVRNKQTMQISSILWISLSRERKIYIYIYSASIE